jgi:hypothetical protein
MPGKGWNIARNFFPVPWLIPWKTGRYYSSPFLSSVVTSVLGTSIIYCSPIYVPNVEGVTVTSLGLEVVTAGAAGSLTRCALYEYVEHTLFGKRLIDSGSFLTDGTGHKFGTVSVYVPQGWYIYAACSNGGSLRNLSGTEVPAFVYGGAYPLQTAGSGWAIRVTLSTAAVQAVIDNGYPLYMPNTADVISLSSNTTSRVLLGV